MFNPEILIGKQLNDDWVIKALAKKAESASSSTLKSHGYVAEVDDGRYSCIKPQCGVRLFREIFSKSFDRRLAPSIIQPLPAERGHPIPMWLIEIQEKFS